MKSGFFSINSAKMQPTAQMSTPRLYCFWPKRTSGALYHRVSISWVKVLMGIPKALANPKSAIFKSPYVKKVNTIFVNEEILGLKISVDDSSGVAEVNSVDQLEHEELDLVAGDVGRVELEIFFEIVIGEFKNEMELFLAWAVDDVHETDA